MALLTPQQLRDQGVETDLSDAALQTYLDDADEEIRLRFGPHAGTGQLTENLEGGALELFPRRRVQTVQTLEEYVGTTKTTLQPDDYLVADEGRWITRLPTGPNPRATWAPLVTATFDPVSDDALRTRVTVDLCRLAINYDAQKQVRDGQLTTSPVEYQQERDAILEDVKRSSYNAVTIA